MMKLKPSCAAAVALAITFAVPAMAQTVAPGPYYATPSWDQQLRCDAQGTCPRFIVLSNWNNDAVLDRETGLVWEQSPSPTARTWFQAPGDCYNKNVGGRKGWRLPTIDELSSLLEPTVPFPGPALPAGHPFTDVQQSLYWSATNDHADTSRAWLASFRGCTLCGPGGFAASHPKSNDNFFGLGFVVWCVRGGQGAYP